ncbi:MAG: hypothetical protein ABJB86_00620 [Bacteroidota bacterium]
MIAPIAKWLRISFFNLLIVASLGIILRYKIAFALPFVDQKYLLHAHSHFAFAGWITQILMVLLVAYLSEHGQENSFQKYRLLLYSNLATAYGMLFTFSFQGYGLFSIGFSFLSIIVSYWFAIRYWKDLNKLKVSSVAHSWFKTAVLLNALSSAGVFGLAFIMATKTHHPNIYLASIYFYLHFQYNGWFFFACMGLLCTRLVEYGINSSRLKKVYQFFVIACGPAYLLSVLWLRLPIWLYSLIVAAVLLQISAWLLLLISIKPVSGRVKTNVSVVAQRLILLSAIAVSIKLCLQAGSVIPSLSKMAFGFRPIVIGYLHLVLLGMITLFIAGFTLSAKYFVVTRLAVAGITVFVLGILFNEALLLLQGIADLNYIDVPYINTLLLMAAVTLFAGILFFNLGLRKSIT